MQDKLISKVTIDFFDGMTTSKDVIVHLKNGRVIQISPDFNLINIWETEKDFDNFSVGKQTVVSLDMGGDACGELLSTSITLQGVTA